MRYPQTQRSTESGDSAGAMPTGKLIINPDAFIEHLSSLIDLEIKHRDADEVLNEWKDKAAKYVSALPSVPLTSELAAEITSGISAIESTLTDLDEKDVRLLPLSQVESDLISHIRSMGANNLRDNLDLIFRIAAFEGENDHTHIEKSALNDLYNIMEILKGRAENVQTLSDHAAEKGED